MQVTGECWLPATACGSGRYWHKAETSSLPPSRQHPCVQQQPLSSSSSHNLGSSREPPQIPMLPLVPSTGMGLQAYGSWQCCTPCLCCQSHNLFVCLCCPRCMCPESEGIAAICSTPGACCDRTPTSLGGEAAAGPADSSASPPESGSLPSPPPSPIPIPAPPTPTASQPPPDSVPTTKPPAGRGPILPEDSVTLPSPDSSVSPAGLWLIAWQRPSAAFVLSGLKPWSSCGCSHQHDMGNNTKSSVLLHIACHVG